MDNQKQFNLWNRICAAAAFVVSAITYLLTIEPSASFWDCGEFIASSYKLEVGHPPGNPMFQLIARFFTLFGDNMHAAALVNSLSAICSALTIFFLYLTIVWFAKRMIRSGNVLAICGSGLVGALAYCFSDTFWFSAVEGEVYAMSSLFTALVFWAMTKWYDQAEEPHSSRWIVLIALLMGLSIGIHLLNLLAIPALVFMFYFRKKEDGTYTFWQCVKIFLLSCVILLIILAVIIPYLPKMAAYVDLFFVNVLGLPFNSGAAFFLVAILALCFWGVFRTMKKNKVFWNTALLCVTMVIIGFSVFSIDVIRSCAKTPTNEYQPDNAFTLVRYLSREQYGKSPLIYGQYYDAPYDLVNSTYWTPLGNKYKKAEAPVEARYRSEGKMLFPRMWNSEESSIAFYETYTDGKGKKVPGASSRKPTMGANLLYFFDFQMNWMYWRYFMWNFVGRQNDVHSPSPGNIFIGNWESGVKFLDDLRLGDQSDAPGYLKDNEGKNHYYFLPLLLGLLGLFFQFSRDKRGCWLTFLMFFMTGIAIVLYLNQQPYQVRERDYAYAGSFYFFSVWIGLAVAAVSSWISDGMSVRLRMPATALVTAVFLCVPALMASENWDDHDRSNRRTAVEMGSNYLNSVGPNGILITHGDNDTFPLWYAQEVENVRTDVRICNTSLLGTDWYIDQMKYACNESAPLDLSIGKSQYLYGTNEIIPIYDSREEVMSISDVIAIFKDPRIKVQLESGRRVDYIPTRKISVPVNKENVIKYGILDAKYADRIPDEIVLTMSKDKSFITKPELFMLDFLSGYRWDRPVNTLMMGGDLDIGIKDYLEFEGLSCKLVPIKNKTTASSLDFVDPDNLYKKLMEDCRWDAVSRDDYFVDYQNKYTFLGSLSIRSVYANAAQVFIREGDNERAEEVLDYCQTLLDPKRYPLETLLLGFSGNDLMICQMVESYYKIGKPEKARELAVRMGSELLQTSGFLTQFYEYAPDSFEMCANYVYYLTDVMKEGGDTEMGTLILDQFKDMLTALSERLKG